MDPTPAPDSASATEPVLARKRPPPGERRLQILQMLAQMLEAPGAERITTAALAARLEVSEAALYRHFASKAQMFEGLLDFIESSLLTLVNRITTAGDETTTGRQQCRAMVTVVLQFAQKNPGMARVMVGDALVLEHPRLQVRMNQLWDKLEAALRQALRHEQAGDTAAAAAVVSAFMVGRLHRFVRGDFRKPPTEHMDEQLHWILG